MFHLMKYCFLNILREKSVVFWSLLFPILLGTLFYVSFGHVGDEIETISAAVVKEDESDNAKAFEEYIKAVEKDESEIIALKEMSDKEAMENLKAKEIKGVFYCAEETRLAVSENSVESSVLQSLLDTFNGQSYMYQEIIKEHPEKLQEIMQEDEFIELVDEVTLTGKKVDGMVQYFYSLIAMGCMFGCFIGLQVSKYLNANIEEVGIRRAITPTHKLKQILSDTIVAFLIHYFNIVILLLYIQFVLGIDLGDNVVKLYLIGAVGSLIGVSMGIFIGSISKVGEEAKIGIMLSVSLGGSFLAGLMISGMKGVVEQHCPILNKINPAAVISDAVYCLGVYDDSGRYVMDMCILLVMSVLLSTAAFMMTRRVRYDSI